VKSLSSSAGMQKREILQCERCGLMQSTGMPLSNLHDGEKPVFTMADSPHEGDVTSVSVPLGALSPDFGKREIAEINSFNNPPGTFLNIGHDSMDILETARLKGWNSAAVAWIEEASANQTASVVQKGLGKLRYDVVRLESSLEFSREPISFLQRIARVMRKEGLLVISTPDCTGWDFNLFGDGSFRLDNDIPCWFFTPETLRLLLEKVGFKVIKVTNFTMQCGHQPGIVPLNIAGDAPQNELTNCEISSKIRYFRVFARLKEATQNFDGDRYNFAQQSIEAEEKKENHSLVFIE